MAKRIAIQELSWKQIRNEFSQVNPELGKIIDDLDPDDSYTLYRAKYPYGSEILIDGKFYLPTEDGELIPFIDSAVDKKVQEDLGYVKDTNPMSMILKNSMELFIPIENRVIPYALVSEGKLFGVWGTLEYWKQSFLFYTPIPLWGATAGARSIFLLPQISSMTAFSKLKKQYRISQEPPSQLVQHWKILREITANKDFSQPWELDILFFSKKWIEVSDDPAWYNFRSYVTNTAWNSSEFWRNQFSWDITLSRIQEKRNLRPCPFAADIARHLLAISVGAVPGFQPLIDNHVAPIDGLKKVFEQAYESIYAPIFVGPAHFSVFNEKDPVYYSFHYHTAMKMAQKNSKRSSAITDLYNIKVLLRKYIEEITNSDLKISGTALYEMAQLVNFEFCHYMDNADLGIISPNDLVASDTSFQRAIENCSVKSMAKNAPFLNGIVQIAKK